MNLFNLFMTSRVVLFTHHSHSKSMFNKDPWKMHLQASEILTTSLCRGLHRFGSVDREAGCRVNNLDTRRLVIVTMMLGER